MRALKVLVRVILALVLGWFMLLVPMALAGLFGIHSWGFMHSGLVLISLPFTIWAAYWLLGFAAVFKSTPDNDASPNSPPVA